ncbi:MAG TPA: thioesterase family protein [Candidatus Cloacimonadota bacterium]|nr:thioesterase family protein [Candidatus Cloacimonadota bacterium]HQL15471.1 thioesterase family protein [Candidatus Cloacimonadota bacterium]
MFIFRKRIYGYECDIYGHLNNADYLPILEAARSEAMQEMGVSIKKMLEANWQIYVLHFELDYLKALKLEEVIEVHSRILSVNKLKSEWMQEIYNAEGELCFTAKMTAVFAHNGKPARLLPEFFEVFARNVERP